MGKTVKIFLLFTLLALIIGGALIQTPFAQNKVRAWIESRSEGTLTIGELEGFFPFWFRLRDVHYVKDSTEATFDKVDLFLSPSTLFLGRLSILRLQIDHADIQIGGNQSPAEWPTLPIPLLVHSMRIDSLTLNDLPEVSLTGMGELEGDFSAQLTVAYEEYRMKLNLEGDSAEKRLRLVSRIKESPDTSLWFNGVYEWEKETFVGEVYGTLQNVHVKSEIHFADALLTFTESTVEKELFSSSVSGQLNWATRRFQAEAKGQWDELSFSDVLLTGEWKEGALTFEATLHDLVISDPAYEVFPTTHLKFKGTATKKKLSLMGELWGVSDHPFTLTAEIPFDATSPFSARLQGRGSLDPLLSFLENASLIARGEVTVDLTFTGSWQAPTIEGSLIYEKGWMESLTTGAVFRDLHMVMEGEGNTLQIRSLTARDHGRGTLSGTGEIRWNPKEDFPFTLQIDTQHFSLLTLDPFTANVGAKLAISGTLQAISIDGTAVIEEGHLAIPNKVPTTVPTVEVTYIHPIASSKPELEEKSTVIPIQWNVQVEIPKNLTIDGRGLVSEWRGSLHIFGEQAALQYAGKLKLVQGRFALAGRSFDLTEGQIVVEGLEPKDIYVDIKGDLELATITASLLLSGSLDATHVAFSSTPPMSTNQILSWILFNQDVNELSPFQACRLANVLVTLSGKYSGPKVFDNIKQGLGIDVFDITNCDLDSADLTFQVGKYISQGTFVGVNKSFSGDYDSVLIQTRLYRNFYLEGNYGGSLNGLTPNGGKVIFKWYKTY
ncbi:MAG: hypothetical protein S4CHLAM2_02510 [Chlamydiales bacterium]|nr:hypothetical protein [Chlamydiales bacterium]